MRRPWAKASIFLYLVIPRCRGQKWENPRRAKYLEITADNLKQGKWSLGYVAAVDWRAVSHRPRADIRGVKGAFSKVTRLIGGATAFLKWAVEVGVCLISASRSWVALFVSQSRKIEC